MYIFYWLMNAAIVNSYILFKDASTAPHKKKYGQIDFQHELAIGLINNYMGRQLNPQAAPLYIGPHAPTNFVNHQNVHMNEDHVKTCKGHQKFEGKRKCTVFGCQACNIFLCKTCHAKWHSAQN